MHRQLILIKSYHAFKITLSQGCSNGILKNKTRYLNESQGNTYETPKTCGKRQGKKIDLTVKSGDFYKNFVFAWSPVLNF